jgi:DNA-directed RNA polymerase subunit RPC12/RpoP
MKCQHCSEEIGDDFFAAWDKNPRSKSGRFRCPHCSADYVRREIGKTPEGKPLYTFRLWGHPTSSRQKKKPDSGRP